MTPKKTHMNQAKKQQAEKEFESFSERLLYRERADTEACNQAYADIALSLIHI